MGIYNSPPPARTRIQDNPTLLYSWWCTIFSAVIILFRCAGRLIRNDMLFREDKIMLVAIIPLLGRMAFIHVVLLWGTNNADLSDDNNPTDLRHREIGSRLVLAARVFYALFIWTAKFSVLEFLQRLTSRFWKRSFEIAMHCIVGYLVVTMIAVVLATILECQPITHYWQVKPYPGPQCTEAYVQLITMATADITTDLLIVLFPIPVIIASAMPVRKKISLILLFSLSVVLIVITAVRVPSVINHHGQQQYRTVWASSEILAASAVANTIVIGSFLRDRGLKKPKYRLGSQTDSMDRRSTRRPTLTSAQWGSDEDLAAELGYRLNPELCRQIPPRAPRPAEVVQGNGGVRDPSDMAPITSKDWQFPEEHDDSGRASEDSDMRIEKLNGAPPTPREPVETPMLSPRTIVHPNANTSFFDMGGLLSNAPYQSRRPTSTAPHSTLMSLSEHPDAQYPTSRRGSRALLADIGGLLSPSRVVREHDSESDHPTRVSKTSRASSRSNLAPPRGPSRSRSRSKSPFEAGRRGTPPPPSGVPSPMITTKLTREQTLQDVGGLLSPAAGAARVAPPSGPTQLQDPGGLLGADPHALQNAGGLLGEPSAQAPRSHSKTRYT